MFQKVKILFLVCDHVLELPNEKPKACGKMSILSALRFQDIKKDGWALGSDEKCYCPEHAPFHRNVGRTGKPRKHLQLKMEDIDDRKQT